MLRPLRRNAYYIAYFLRTRVGRKRPLLASVKLSHRCNLRCQHCPFWRDAGPSLSYVQALGALQALHAAGVRIAIFEGGEPFLWRDGQKDIRDLVREAKQLFFSVGVTTNGTLPIAADADVIWVSIDGLKDTHNAIRGRTFDRILANIASSLHPRIFAHITINSLNWQEVPALVRFLSTRVKGVTVQFHYPYGEGERDLSLTRAQRHEVLDELVQLKRNGMPVADSRACLRALADNSWTCYPWMVTSVHPDGKIVPGCYVQGRGAVSCERCGFAVHAEISLAYAGSLGPILTGNRIFW